MVVSSDNFLLENIPLFVLNTKYNGTLFFMSVTNSSCHQELVALLQKNNMPYSTNKVVARYSWVIRIRTAKSVIGKYLDHIISGHCCQSNNFYILLKVKKCLLYTDDKDDVFSRDPFVVLMDVPCIGGKTFLKLAFPLIRQTTKALKKLLRLVLDKWRNIFRWLKWCRDFRNRDSCYSYISKRCG